MEFCSDVPRRKFISRISTRTATRLPAEVSLIFVSRVVDSSVFPTV